MSGPIACSPSYSLTGTGKVRRSSATCGYFATSASTVANLDINRLYAGPFGARTEEPAAASDHTRGVERIAGNRELHQLAAAHVWPNHHALGRAIDPQH